MIASGHVETIGWLTKQGLDRHRPLFLACQFSLLIIGVLFWIEANSGGRGFSEDVYGQFAYSLPAKFWAAWMMGGAALMVAGLKKPVCSWQVQVGALSQCAMFMLLSYSSVFTNGEFVIGIFASSFFLPLHMWILFEARRAA